MNCLLEAVAGVYLAMRARLAAEPVEAEVFSAQDGLESCRKTMESRERELVESARRLGEAALSCKRLGDTTSARARVLERRRIMKRLDKLRGGLGLVDSQLDAIKMSELDKEIMLTLRQSTSAMKKAGIGVAIQEAEKMMGELDDHMREIQDVTSLLANPVGPSEEELDLDEELQWLEDTPLLERERPKLPASNRRLPAILEPPERQDSMPESEPLMASATLAVADS